MVSRIIHHPTITVTTPRLLWADVARVCAISGVVLVHTWLLPDSVAVHPEANVLGLWAVFTVAKTAVPLFLMLTGALLLSKTEPDSVFFGKRLRRILVPWIIWTCVYVLLWYRQDITSLGSLLATSWRVFMSEFTYIPMIFGIYLLLPYVRLLVKHATKRQRWLLILLWFVGVSLLPTLRDSLAFPLHVDAGLVRQVFQYVGYVLLGYEIWTGLSQRKPTVWVWVTATASFVLSSLFLAMRVVATPELALDTLSYVSPLLVVSAASLFCLFIGLGNVLLDPQPQPVRHPVARLLVAASMASFGLYFVHRLVLRAVATVLPPAAAASTWQYQAVLYLVVLCFSFGLSLGLQQIPKVGKRVG